jgi:hypothetical protein
MNGPNFTWPLLLFASALPEGLMVKMGKIYRGQPLPIKSRKELLASIKRQHWKYLRADNGDLPDEWDAVSDAEHEPALLRVLGAGLGDQEKLLGGARIPAWMSSGQSGREVVQVIQEGCSVPQTLIPALGRQ